MFGLGFVGADVVDEYFLVACRLWQRRAGRILVEADIVLRYAECFSSLKLPDIRTAIDCADVFFSCVGRNHPKVC